MEYIIVVLSVIILLLIAVILLITARVASATRQISEDTLARGDDSAMIMDSVDQAQESMNELRNNVAGLRDSYIAQRTDSDNSFKRIREDIDQKNRIQNENLTKGFQFLNGQIKTNNDAAVAAAAASSEAQMKLLQSFNDSTNKMLESIRATLDTRLESQNKTLNEQFTGLRTENTQQIEKIRESVSEKLDKTLNDQFDKSFKGLIQQMENLSATMGELKGISGQVGTLEKTLNGVKTRGIIGENQLKLIIADILNPQQYDVEVPTIPGSSNKVEIAIKLPSRDSNDFSYLPIDSKCHTDRYEELMNALESCDKDAITKARAEFRTAIKNDAKTIVDKYVKVPHTTPYAILFVPFEGMYSEIVNLNILEELNRMNVTVVGPYTLTAVLSTVVNYWQALAIEKKSQDIEKTLMTAKLQFEKFDKVLGGVKNNLNNASTKIDELQGKRTRAILRALKDVPTLASDNIGNRLAEGIDSYEDMSDEYYDLDKDTDGGFDE